MTREEEIRKAIDTIFPIPASAKGRDYEQALMATGFQAGAQWADNNPKSPWIKFTEKFPPHQEPIIIAMKNKNKEDGIWLYDLCKFFGGDYIDNNNWEEKVNWEIPIYWMPIPNLPKQQDIKL